MQIAIPCSSHNARSRNPTFLLQAANAAMADNIVNGITAKLANPHTDVASDSIDAVCQAVAHRLMHEVVPILAQQEVRLLLVLSKLRQLLSIRPLCRLCSEKVVINTCAVCVYAASDIVFWFVDIYQQWQANYDDLNYCMCTKSILRVSCIQFVSTVISACVDCDHIMSCCSTMHMPYLLHICSR